MSFEMTEPVSLEQELADLADSAPNPTPKRIKSALERAAQEITRIHRLHERWREQLLLAASLKPGQMDSQSRADEIHRQVSLTLTSIAAEMA